MRGSEPQKSLLRGAVARAQSLLKVQNWSSGCAAADAHHSVHLAAAKQSRMERTLGRNVSQHVVGNRHHWGTPTPRGISAALVHAAPHARATNSAAAAQNGRGEHRAACAGVMLEFTADECMTSFLKLAHPERMQIPGRQGSPCFQER